jgi:hypothetical protein
MKLMFTILLTMYFTFLQAPPSGAGVIFEAEGVNPYEAIWNAVCQVESSGNPLAVGDKNLKLHSYGIAQIRQSRLDDYFRQTGIRYNETDMFCPVKSKQVFMFYCSQIGENPERIAREWNGGEQGMKRKSTLKYWDKVQKIMYRWSFDGKTN